MVTWLIVAAIVLPLTYWLATGAASHMKNTPPPPAVFPTATSSP